MAKQGFGNFRCRKTLVTTGDISWSASESGAPTTFDWMKTRFSGPTPRDMSRE
jgi:hypothetical protein